MKTLLTLAFTSLFALSGFAQNESTKEYLNNVFKSVSKSEAVYYRESAVQNDGFVTYSVYFLNGDIRMTGRNIHDNGRSVKHGLFTYYYENGSIESSGYYEKGIKVGSWKRFTSNGIQRADRYYSPESADFLRTVMGGWETSSCKMQIADYGNLIPINPRLSQVQHIDWICW